MQKEGVKEKHHRNKTENLDYLRRIHHLDDSPLDVDLFGTTERIEFDNYLVNKTINKEKILREKDLVNSKLSKHLMWH